MFLALCLLLIGSVLPDAEAADSNVMHVVDASNRFAFDLYKALAEEDQDNIVFSPISISAALSQLMMGAGDQTQQKLRKVLHLRHADKDWIHPSYTTLLDGLQVSHGARNVLLLANRVFMEDDYDFLSKFSDDSKVFYSAKPELLDFADAEVARRQINKIIERETKVSNLMSSEHLQDNALLAVATSGYFRRAWLNEFVAEKTRLFQFRKTPDDVFDAEIMIGHGMFHGTYDKEMAARLVEMPFSDNKRKLVILMPSGVEAGLLDRLSENLDYDYVKEIQESLKNEKPFDILFPKMRLGDSLDMKKALSSLGLAELFEANKPDLSAVSKKDLHIDSFMHKVSLDFNEEGVQRTESTELPEGRDRLVILRPFMFYIQDVSTGAIVVMGRVRNPATAPKDGATSYNTRADDGSQDHHKTRHDEL